MTDLQFLILAAAFLALLAVTTAAIPRHAAPARLCAVRTLPATCGDAR